MGIGVIPVDETGAFTISDFMRKVVRFCTTLAEICPS